MDRYGRGYVSLYRADGSFLHILGVSKDFSLEKHYRYIWYEIFSTIYNHSVSLGKSL